MTESFLITLFKVIWQDLTEDAAYDSTKQNWQALQVVIDEIKENKQVSRDLAIALEKSYYLSDKTIVKTCHEELIKNSTFVQYRGAKIYKPPENDTGIRKLDSKSNLIDKQLKQLGKKLFAKKSFINPSDLEELVRELSQMSYEASEAKKKYAWNQLVQEVEKDCEVNLYQTRIRDKKNGLRKFIFDNFLIEIEPNEQLNRIFSARTYLILKNIREKV